MKYFYLCLTVSFVLCSCSSRPSLTVEKSVAQQNTSNAALLKVPKNNASRTATVAEVCAALRRIFGNVVSIDRQEQSFVTGDFNGDRSPDLAVLVRPSRASLRTINDPLSNWTIQDASQAFFPPANQRVLRRRKTPRAIVGANELLIAIIHGYGAEGWRNPQARQAYLVRNGGSAPLRAIPAPGHVEGAPISISHSQIICAESKRPGFLFWTGSQYGWRTIHTPEQAAAVAKSRD